MGYGYTRPHRDANHGVIVAALKAVGCSIIDCAPLGGGVPDVVAFRNGATYLLEIKARTTHARRAKGEIPGWELLTDDEITWMASHGDKGPPVHIVHDAAEALAVVVSTQAERDAVLRAAAPEEKHQGAERATKE